MLQVDFPGHNKRKVVVQGQPAVCHQNQRNRCLPCQNDTTMDPQTSWWIKEIGAAGPEALGQPTLKQISPLPELPTAPPGDNHGAQCSQPETLPAVYVHSQVALSSTEFCNLEAYPQDGQHQTDYNPDMLTDERTSAGWYTIGCVVMQPTFNFKTRAAYSANLAVTTSIDRKEKKFSTYYCLQLRNKAKYILENIMICISKERYSDPGEYHLK